MNDDNEDISMGNPENVEKIVTNWYKNENVYRQNQYGGFYIGSKYY